jgi:hypothetical protein
VDLSSDQMTSDLTKNLKCMEQLRAERQLPEPFTTVGVGACGVGERQGCNAPFTTVAVMECRVGVSV